MGHWAYLVPFPKYTVISVELQFFLIRVYFAPPTEGVSLGFGYLCSGSKTRMKGLLGRERSFTIYSAIWIHHEPDRQTDGRPDGHRATANTALTHSVVR